METKVAYEPYLSLTDPSRFGLSWASEGDCGPKPAELRTYGKHISRSDLGVFEKITRSEG